MRRSFLKYSRPCDRLCRCAVLGTIFLLIAVNLSAQQPIPPPDWSGWQFLLGDWVGEGSGAPGEALGGFSFGYDLQQRILVRKNVADYPATPERPAFSHTDLMIIYRENDTTRAVYFDNEGHIIHYTVALVPDSGMFVFLSEALSTAPRFRFTYSKIAVDRVKIQFDIAPPGKPEAFAPYITAAARRK